MFETIPHGSYPYDESPWIKHFRDADDANQRAQIHGAMSANASGQGALARHIMGARPGENPFTSFRGPFDDGADVDLQNKPRLPNQLYGEYFSGYRRDGDARGQGPFADPRKFTPDGAYSPLVTGDAYRAQQSMFGAPKAGLGPLGNGPLAMGQWWRPFGVGGH